MNSNASAPALLILLVCLWTGLLTNLAIACQYNVRDVGFVDLGVAPYSFYGYVSQETSANLVSNFTQMVSTAFQDSNVQPEIIQIDKQKDHPALKYLPASTPSFPAAVLVSSDGPALALPVAPPGGSSSQALASTLRQVVTSPKRQEILSQASRAFAVILLIEGIDREENNRSRKAIADAIDQVRAQMRLMPKTNALPPVLVVLDSTALSGEKILLWSLGLNTNTLTKTHAAVFYGKARWIGPLMKESEISEANLSRILSFIGADCECGLDLSWTRGTQLPIQWEEKWHERAAQSLGFDPENPMVKIEVSRILGRFGGEPSVSASSPGAAAFGYQEWPIEPESSSSGGVSAAGQSAEHGRPDRSQLSTNSSEGHSPAAPVSGGLPIVKKSLMAIAGLAIVSILTGVIILVRGARR